MCGIAGLLGGDGDAAAAASAMADALVHRGPDDGGVTVIDGGAGALAHRRLSILDLSAAGRQPMGDPDGRVLVTYNGEIYNHLALREELCARGHRFRTRTDTEVLVHGWLEWGELLIPRLEGMFAFAIWDVAARCLVLARDHVGMKPLYYYDDGRRFAFASEAKAFARVAGLDLTLDESALYDFLTYLYVPAPKSAWQRVRKLEPGHYLVRAASGAVRIERWWDVDFGARRVTRAAQAKEELAARLDAAVRSHLMSDVPVGCLLSGGVDSSAVAALAMRHVDSPLRTFAIGFDVAAHGAPHGAPHGAAHGELEWARLVAKSCGTVHEERIVALADAREALPRLMERYDEPFGDSSAIPTLAVCETARQKVTVALSGDGGDELFGGYDWYGRHLRRARFPRLPAPLAAALPALLERSSLARLRGMPTLIDGVRDPLERHVVAMGGLTRAQKRAVLGEGAWRRFAGYDDLWHFRRHWRPELDLLSRLQYLDLMTYLPDDILTKVDRASMAVSLELRPPLLDRRLIEFVAGIASEVRCPGGAPKHLFKQALAGIVPAEVLARRKQGFSIPLTHWSAGLLGAARPGLAPHHALLTEGLRGWLARHAPASDLLA